MNSNSIQTLFQSQFDYSTYSRQIVHDVFGCNDIEQTLDDPIDISAAGDKSYYIGQMEDSNHQLLGFFYTRTAEGSDVRRKRVGWRKLISPYLKYHVDAAVAVFDDGQHWRLSYICDQKESLTAAKRFSYVMGDAAGQYKTPVARLGRVAACEGRFKLGDIFEAFSVEALSNQFFDEYRNYYADIVEDLTGKRMVKVSNNWVEKVIHAPLQSVYEQLDGVEDADKMVRDYVKKLLGRIVFLHFLQKKGWLNGNPAFLSDLFFMQPLDRKADFLEKVLEPLFFGIFNTERAGREKLFAEQGWDMELMEQWRDLPFLNGGLFERDEVDKVHVRLPEQRFKKLFEFLASYNFTVDENDPDDAEVGVDLEMLGKIFESLLEDNKSKGAFYTPKEIVRYMCKESLIAYLSSKISEQSDVSDHLDTSIRQFVEQHELPAELEPYRETLDAALRNVKICDPAIGSGAFPMGLLNELWRCREALQDNLEVCDFNNPTQEKCGDCDRREQTPPIYSQCGECAVTSTESPLRARGTRPQSRVDLKKEIIENNIYGVDIERGAIDIARLWFWLSIVVDAEEPEPLPNFDYKFMQGNSLIESFEGHDLSRIMDTRPLTGRGTRRAGWAENQTGMDFSSDDTRQNLRIWLKKYFSLTDHKEKAHYRELINGSVKSYIKQQGIGPTAEAKLDKLDPSANQDFFLWHTWFKDIFDNGGFDIVIGNPPYISAVEMVRTENEKTLYKKTYPQATGAYDIYVLFLLRGLMLSKNVFSWIIPNKFLIADYAKKTKALLELKGLYSSIDVSTFNVFKNASVYPIIVCGSKSNKNGFCKYILDYYEDLLLNKAQPVKEIETSLIVKDCGITVCSGATGFEAQKIKEYVVDGESDNVIPFTVSGNIDRYTFNNRDVRYMKSKYCNAYIRLDCDVASSKLNMWMSPKIIIAGMTKVIESTYVETPLAIGVGVYAVTSFGIYSPYYITGLLNSKYTSYYLRNKFKDKHLAGGYLAINKSTIEQLPFISADTKTQESISSKVKKITVLKKANPYADTASIENEIDKLVYQLYNLTPIEIAIIEQNR